MRAGPIGAALLLGFLAARPGAAQTDDRAAFVSWARANARPLTTVDLRQPIEDLAPIASMVGTARIVGVGESAHGIHEFLGLRARIARFLIERLGFTAVALETGLPDAKAVSDYVLGGPADPELWTRGLTWTMGSHGETRELVEWMRAWNLDPSHRRKVRFYGMDVAGANGGWVGAAEGALTYLMRVEPGFAASARNRLVPLVQKFARPGFTETNDAFAALSAEERNALVAVVAEVADRFDLLRLSYLARTGFEDFDWARQIAENLRFAATMVVNYEAKDRPDPVWNARDLAMARNVRWIREREGPSGGVVVLAHNAHVQTAMSTQVAPNMASLGVFLRSLDSAGYRNIGFTFGRGAMPIDSGRTIPLPPADTASLDAALGAVGRPLFFLDLTRIPATGAGRRWLDRPILQRIQSVATTYPQLRSWNGLIYVESIGPSRPERIAR
jgi:erythromycin esterase